MCVCVCVCVCVSVCVCIKRALNICFNVEITEGLTDEHMQIYIKTRSVARKETLDVHQKNWVCHMYCQINAKK